MPTADSARAQSWGGRLGRWAGGATIAAIRIGLVAASLAAVWHALVPGMPFGAWMIIFFAVNAFAWPFNLVGRALRGAIDRARGPSGFVRRSRVHPPL